MKKYLAIYLIINTKDTSKIATWQRIITAKTFKKAYILANEEKEKIMEQYLKLAEITEKEGIFISVVDIINKKT